MLGHPSDKFKEIRAADVLHKKPRVELFIEVSMHIITWAYIFLSPLFFKHRGDSIDWGRYVHGCSLPLATCIAFYLNYFVLIPRLLLGKGRGKLKWFVLINVALFAFCEMGMEFQNILLPPPEFLRHPRRFDPERPFMIPRIFFVIRGFLTMLFAVGASVALKLSMRWRKSEQARAEAELGRSQAELKNLKNQINPHFLLNTLNNIYSLTGFDQEKAQQAIHELSRLLRYMLYESQDNRVTLTKEVEFLDSYIALMKLRIYNDVDVQVNFDFSENEHVEVAPFIFISLVENAFKHGICSTGKSFIHISLKSDKHHLKFKCENSNTPKDDTDKAPGGIGLQQVANRLELSYPGRYDWKSGVKDDGSTFSSVINIYDKPLKH